MLQKLNPFAKPKVKPKPNGVVGQLRQIGESIVTETSQIPKSILQTGVESVGVRIGASTHKPRVESVSPYAQAEHSQDVLQYLYGGSLTPEQRAAAAQKQQYEQSGVPNEINEQRRKIQEMIAFKNRRAWETSPQPQMSVQEQQEREEQQEKQQEMAQAQEKQRFANVALPTGTSKKPTLGMQTKKKRGDMLRHETGKGS